MSTRPVLAVRLGRGRTGGTTGLDWLIQRAQAASRPILVADGDKRNATLSGLYNGHTLQPSSDATGDVKDWISSVLDQMATARISAALDLGGGDRVLHEYGLDMELVEFCASIDVSPLALYFLGPERDDLEHAFALFTAKVFRPDHTIIVLNEALIKMSQSPQRAFARVVQSEEMRAMTEAGAKFIGMQRLPCLDQIRAAGISFNAAAADKDHVIGPVASFMVRRWLHHLEEQCERAGVQEWLP